MWPIDHDDGSQYYTDSQNYIIYGGYKSYLGNSLTVLDNVYVLPDGKVDAWEESRKERSGEEESLFANEKLQSSVLDGLSSIMKARARNLDQRYRVDKRKYDERDQRRAAGLPPSTASSLDQADDGALGWSRNWGQYCAQDGGGYGHLWENNTCAVMSVANIYNFWQCDPDNLPLSIPFVAANNLYASGQINITCAASGKWWTLQSFQAIGYDLLTTQYPPATLDQLISWGRATFNLSSSSSSEATAAPLEDQPISAYAALCR